MWTDRWESTQDSDPFQSQFSDVKNKVLKFMVFLNHSTEKSALWTDGENWITLGKTMNDAVIHSTTTKFFSFK